jgi:hypothetical protein
MLEKITGYTAMIEMLKNTNVITAGSLKLVSLTGNTEDSIMVMIKTTFTKISCAQPVVMFFDAARQRVHT